MRYSVFVVTAAQYIGQLYAALAKGRPFGEAASEGRKHLAAQPRPLGGAGAAAAARLVRAGGLRGDADPPAAGRRATRGLALDQRPSWTPSRPTRPCCATCPTPASSAATRRCCCSTAPSTATRSCCCTPTPGRARPPPRSSSPAGTPRPAASARSRSCCSPRSSSHTDLTDVLNQVGQLFGPLLQANGIEWHALNRRGQRRSLVLQLLRQIPVLWIWDNVEPVAGFPAGTESQWTRGGAGRAGRFPEADQAGSGHEGQDPAHQPPRRSRRGWAASRTGWRCPA